MAGADLWEALMARAGKKARRYFLSAASLRCWRRRKQNYGHSGTSILWVAGRLLYAGAASGAICAYPCQRRENCHRRDGIAKTGIANARLSGSASPCVIYGVGGTYDVFTGHVKRAPKIWQNLGLEWLYRLLSQPKRITRQMRLLRYLRWHYTGDL